MFSPLVQQLIDSLRILPGVGPKSAQRMALQLLERERKNGLKLATSLNKALTQVGHCRLCRNFCETDICALCNNNRRNPELLCIVETPGDVIALEQTASFNGLYFVLMGHLSPMDGIGPEAIGVPELLKRTQTSSIKEIILATNPTVEGEVTAQYISAQIKPFGIKCSRIAHGVPLDGELGYLDAGTLQRALSARTEIEA